MKRLASAISGISAALFLGAILALGGCVARGGVGYQASATVTTPDLVMISPGVYVIADYGDSVFYTDGWYWRYGGDVWYRSRDYTGGWVVYRDPPPVIRRIDRPHGYAHYRARSRDHRGEPRKNVQDRRHARGDEHGHHGRGKSRDHR